MSIDLSLLTEAPWKVMDDNILRPVDFEFIALARNDLDVRQRRRWWTVPDMAGRWHVPALLNQIHHCGLPISVEAIAASWQDGNDVGLLTKADEWYRENIEASE